MGLWKEGLTPSHYSVSISERQIRDYKFSLLILVNSYVILFFFFFCLFAISRAAPLAYGGSQARGLIRAVATSLYHSSQQRRIFNPLIEARDQTCILTETKLGP